MHDNEWKINDKADKRVTLGKFPTVYNRKLSAYHKYSAETRIK